MTHYCAKDVIAESAAAALETVSAALEPPRAADYLARAERNISFDEEAVSRPVQSRCLSVDAVLQALGPDDPLPLRY